MFRNLARLLPAPEQLFDIHPLQLSRWLDEAWAAGSTVPDIGIDPPSPSTPALGDPGIIAAIDLPLPSPTGAPFPVPSGITTGSIDTFSGVPFPFPAPPSPSAPGLIADHLIYAYLLECTGVVEIMAEVVRRFAVGETLNPVSLASTRWLRTTEELFFREPPLYSIQGIVSEMRPDQRVNRRNAYWRMFGLEPPHAIPSRWTRPGMTPEVWKQDVGGGVNSGFREKWTELLRQVWLGIENANNGVGPNATDREYVAFLCTALRDMLAMRRRGAMLAREEFAYVSYLSYFHTTLDSDTPIVIDLDARGPAPAERLEKIAAKVGMTPAARSRELFDLADLMSGLLRAIELNVFSTGAQAELLYLNLGTNAALLQDMNRIIDLWQSATGDRVKDRPSGTRPQPVRLPNPASPGVPPSPLTAGPGIVPSGAPAPALAAQNGQG
ncbi:hypothetical protein [Kribbella sp. NPDC049227]|uniref:hypothetical protein n=1 Tax=Kribbella sp. NPDC049227 TaxID=3364113 RepID=UPI00370FBF3F